MIRHVISGYAADVERAIRCAAMLPLTLLRCLRATTRAHMALRR